MKGEKKAEKWIWMGLGRIAPQDASIARRPLAHPLFFHLQSTDISHQLTTILGKMRTRPTSFNHHANMQP
jgi:hypothetical protein